MTFEWYEKYYDKYINKICPDYEKALGILVNSIFLKNNKLIELGCGTGNLTLRLSKKFPKTRIFAFDNDENQLKIAKKKLKNIDNVSLINKNVLDLQFNKDEIVVSSLSFHLLPKNQRRIIFQKICNAGIEKIYIFDRLRGETEKDEVKYREYFKNNLIKNKLPTELINDLIKENRTNNSDKLSKQEDFFNQRGYSLNIIFQNPNHGFWAYYYKRQTGD